MANNDNARTSIETIFEVIKDISSQGKSSGLEFESASKQISSAEQNYRHQIEDLKSINDSCLGVISNIPKLSPSTLNSDKINNEARQIEILEQRQQEERAKVAKFRNDLEKIDAHNTKCKLALLSEYKKLSDQLRVYTIASNVVWNPESPSHLVSGYVLTKSGPKPFSFDRQESSTFHICNELWKMIGSS